MDVTKGAGSQDLYNMMSLYTKPDEAMGELFEKAQGELQEVAKKHGFHIRLVDDCKGAWYFYPEIDIDKKEPCDTV